jgi:hypothetical protein
MCYRWVGGDEDCRLCSIVKNRFGDSADATQKIREYQRHPLYSPQVESMPFASGLD